MITNVENIHIWVIKLSNVLSKFTILCWATLVPVPGRMRPAGCGWGNPDSELTCLGLGLKCFEGSDFSLKIKSLSLLFQPHFYASWNFLKFNLPVHFRRFGATSVPAGMRCFPKKEVCSSDHYQPKPRGPNQKFSLYWFLTVRSF